MIKWLLRLFTREPVEPPCLWGCDDKIEVTASGQLFRSTRSIMFKGRCPVHHTLTLEKLRRAKAILTRKAP